MKPLHLCFIGPANNVTTRRWVEWFTRRGHKTTVITVEPATEQIVFNFRQVNVEILYGPRKMRRLVSASWMALMLKRLKPDVVHAHYLRGLAWGLMFSSFHPRVVTPWGSDVLEEQGAFLGWYAKPLTRSLLQSADLITVHSRYMESRLRSLIEAPPPLAQIGWGVDLSCFHPGLAVEHLRQKWTIGQDVEVIFSPRLAQRLYNHHVVIQALKLVRAQFPNVILVIPGQFGDPVYLRELKSLADQLQLSDHVRFVGNIPYMDMPSWLNLAKIVVMVPESDGMPNTLLEAMACGAVPVLRELPQYRELIRDRVNGRYVSARPESIAEAVVALLRDGEQRNRISSANLELVREVADQSKEMHRMEKFYYRLAEERSSCAA